MSGSMGTHTLSASSAAALLRVRLFREPCCGEPATATSWPPWLGVREPEPSDLLELTTEPFWLLIAMALGSSGATARHQQPAIAVGGTALPGAARNTGRAP
mmetsp:Transcript_10825/g.24477  ORF Transcript_10825/g.24477 Transcript_10825/m.24477 type:complete len:101 (-) Transcript_10825:26-328(-)